MAFFPWFEQPLLKMVERHQSKTLHHGILLSGKKGVGKKESLVELAKMLLCESHSGCGQCQSCRLFSAGSHPDFIFPEYENTIGVDLVRECIGKLHQTAHLGGAMVLLLSNIEKMTVASSNALLKTLEEPTLNTYLLLTTNSSNGLLPTILSRCEKHRVAINNEISIKPWLADQGIEVENELIQLYWDRPLFLKEVKSDSSLSDTLFWLQDLHKRHSLSGLPEQLLTEHQLILDWMSHRLRTVMHYESSDQLKTRLYDCYQQILAAERGLNQPGVNKSMLLDKLFFHWREAIKLV